MTATQTATTQITKHAIELDFTNELGQQVIVITCPEIQTTIAIVNADNCTCGRAI
jgi:hypothetical protein